MINVPVPAFGEEELLFANGYRFIAGVDEVGRGCLAGPVMAAAVILPVEIKASWAAEVRDSKLLKPAQRKNLAQSIRKAAVSFGIGTVSHEEIDAMGIAPATRLAMKLAVAQLSPAAEYLLIDYFTLPEVSLPQKGVVDGDSLCFSIACASIVAKEFRDGLMRKLDRAYRGYGFARHKGYCTREHLECLSRLGPCAIHRRSFQPVQEVSCRER